MKRQKYILKDIVICMILALILYLFYKRLWAFVLMIPALIIYRRYSKKEREAERLRTLQGQFRDALTALSDALSAGYSLENAVSESLEEVSKIYGTDAEICLHLRGVVNKMALNIPLEDAFDEMAQCGLEDISLFASVVRTAKRSGGNLVQIIRKSADDIAAKTDVLNEIEVVISSRKLEQTLMIFMPVAIILFIDLASPGLLDPLYGNVRGVVIMTACLGIYALSFFISRKIADIEV